MTIHIAMKPRSHLYHLLPIRLYKQQQVPLRRAPDLCIFYVLAVLLVTVSDVTFQAPSMAPVYEIRVYNKNQCITAVTSKGDTACEEFLIFYVEGGG